MSDKERLSLGGLGALIPSMGAFLAYVHKTERDWWKTVHLGLYILALVLSLLNANRVAPTQREAGGSSPKTTVFALLLVAEASAQENTDGDLHNFTLQKQSIPSKVWHGLVGTPRRHVWFVIADTAPTAEEARQKAFEINKKGGGLRAEIYRPYVDGQGYSVVVGRDLELDEAQKLVEKLNKMTGTTKARVWSPVQQ